MKGLGGLEMGVCVAWGNGEVCGVDGVACGMNLWNQWNRVWSRVVYEMNAVMLQMESHQK